MKYQVTPNDILWSYRLGRSFLDGLERVVVSLRMLLFPLVLCLDKDDSGESCGLQPAGATRARCVRP